MLAATLAHLTWGKAIVAKRCRESIPHEAGVYMLCALPPRCAGFGESAGLFNALYVGRAQNLRHRFGEYQQRINISKGARHILDKLPDKGERISFVYSVVPSEHLRETEGRLIHCLGPAVNKRDEIKVRGKIGRPIPA